MHIVLKGTMTPGIEITAPLCARAALFVLPLIVNCRPEVVPFSQLMCPEVFKSPTFCEQGRQPAGAY